MTGEYLRFYLSLFRKTLPQNLSDTSMQLLFSVAEQGGVCGILDECVFEDVGGLRGDTTPEDQFLPEQPIEGVLKLGILQRRDGSEKLMRKFSTDDGPNLRNLLHRCKPI
jgi:hypothetical protein